MKRRLKRIAILTGGGDVPGLDSAIQRVDVRRFDDEDADRPVIRRVQHLPMFLT